MNLKEKVLTWSGIILIASFMLASCSSSKKMKKKCLDCPEFSMEKSKPSLPQQVNENI